MYIIYIQLSKFSSLDKDPVSHNNMIDFKNIEKGNISLTKSLQSPDVETTDHPFNNREEKVAIIINMQKTLYHVKIEDSENRIKRFFISFNNLYLTTYFLFSLFSNKIYVTIFI